MGHTEVLWKGPSQTSEHASSPLRAYVAALPIPVEVDERPMIESEASWGARKTEERIRR